MAPVYAVELVAAPAPTAELAAGPRGGDPAGGAAGSRPAGRRSRRRSPRCPPPRRRRSRSRRPRRPPPSRPSASRRPRTQTKAGAGPRRDAEHRVGRGEHQDARPAVRLPGVSAEHRGAGLSPLGTSRRQPKPPGRGQFLHFAGRQRARYPSSSPPPATSASTSVRRAPSRRPATPTPSGRCPTGTRPTCCRSASSSLRRRVREPAALRARPGVVAASPLAAQDPDAAARPRACGSGSPTSRAPVPAWSCSRAADSTRSARSSSATSTTATASRCSRWLRAGLRRPPVNYQLYRTLGAEYGVEVRSRCRGSQWCVCTRSAPGAMRQQQSFPIPTGVRA